MARSRMQGKRNYGRVMQIGVNDSVLISLYQGAEVFVYPSLYEGFGIPILEAFACGCPVIASDSSSFPEVMGKAGLLFEPTNALSLEEAITSILSDANLRSRLVDKGFEREKLFSWDRMTDETLQVYGELV